MGDRGEREGDEIGACSLTANTNTETNVIIESDNVRDDDTEMDHTGNSSQKSRIRQYGPCAIAPFVVYVRAKINNGLAGVEISNKLFEKYASIERIHPVNRDKLRVELSSREDANRLPHDQDFSNRHYVYIPAILSEVDGKILLNHNENPDLLATEGYGIMGNSTEEYKVLEVHRLKQRVMINNVQEIKESRFVRVTFEGLVLPDYLIINKLRIPVVPYSPNVMQCLHCLRTGHTAKFCGNRARCVRCGKLHSNSEEMQSCNAKSFHCPNCDSIYTQMAHDCPKVTEIIESRLRRIELIKREVNKSRAGAEARNGLPNNVKNKRRQQQSSIEFPALKVKNRFASLDELEDGEIKDSDYEESMDEDMFPVTTGAIRKRKLSRDSQERQQGRDEIWFRWAEKRNKQDEVKAGSSAQGAQGADCSGRLGNSKTGVDDNKRHNGHGNPFECLPKLIGKWLKIFISYIKGLNLVDGTLLTMLEEMALPWVEKWVIALIPKIVDWVLGLINNHGC